MTKKRTFAAFSILTRSICTVNDNRPLNEWIFLINFCYFPRRSIEISSFGLVCCVFSLENKKRLRLPQLLADLNSDFSSVHRLLYHAVFISHKSVCCVYYFHLVYLLYSVDIHWSISEMLNQLWHDLSLSLCLSVNHHAMIMLNIWNIHCVKQQGKKTKFMMPFYALEVHCWNGTLQHIYEYNSCNSIVCIGKSAY